MQAEIHQRLGGSVDHEAGSHRLPATGFSTVPTKWPIWGLDSLEEWNHGNTIQFQHARASDSGGTRASQPLDVGSALAHFHVFRNACSGPIYLCSFVVVSRFWTVLDAINVYPTMSSIG